MRDNYPLNFPKPKLWTDNVLSLYFRFHLSLSFSPTLTHTMSRYLSLSPRLTHIQSTLLCT